MQATLFTDGGARGNPGPAGMGALLFSDDKLIDFDGAYHEHQTNNQAEYKALLIGLNMARKNKVRNLACFLDSELIVKQLNGEYKVRNESMISLYQEVQKLKENFESIEFVHVPRKQNKHADKLVNIILDSQLPK